MAAASQGLTRDQLVWTRDACVREHCYRCTLATLVDAHCRLPVASIWGACTTSSSDGQFFRGGERLAIGDINARYGMDPGFSFYTHVTDLHAPFNVTVISATAHEAPYVLDGLVHHGSSLKIAEANTDTGGATDHVFALCAMLGFRFCPRLRDFPDRRLTPIAAPGGYPSIASLLGKHIKVEIIRAQWDDAPRLFATVQSGHAAPSTMLRKLAARKRQNQIDVPSGRSARPIAPFSCSTGWKAPIRGIAATAASSRAGSATSSPRRSARFFWVASSTAPMKRCKIKHRG